LKKAVYDFFPNRYMPTWAYLKKKRERHRKLREFFKFKVIIYLVLKKKRERHPNLKLVFILFIREKKCNQILSI